MRDVFSDYYIPAKRVQDALEGSCLRLDTNILLRVYEYGAKTREWFFKILKKLGDLDRLWIPYHVGKEYQDDRLGVISKQREYYHSSQTS